MDCRGRREFVSNAYALGEVEDEVHFVLRCEALSEERRSLLSHMVLVDGYIAIMEWKELIGIDM